MLKRHFIGIACFITMFSLSGCATYFQNKKNPIDYTHETWMNEVESNPSLWTKGADRWFTTGGPNEIEQQNRHDEAKLAMTTMQIDVPNFDGIMANGRFEVQIFTTVGANSVYLYGPNEAVREVNVQVRGSTLCLTETKKASSRMQRVIIRVGINQFHLLKQMGCGQIEGTHLQTQHLNIISTGSGRLYLVGNIGIDSIKQAGTGSINIFGANTQRLAIEAKKSGAVNIAGQVGLESIQHEGQADINIIGATSRGLRVVASGSGKISLNGSRRAEGLAISQIAAQGKMHVYALPVLSRDISVNASHDAFVGLLGRTDHLSVTVSNAAFFAGQYLCTQEAYVRAKDHAHANVAAAERMFASATQNAGIYFFGSPDRMSQFVSNNGTVIPIWLPDPRGCVVVRDFYPVRRDYKGEGRAGFSHQRPMYYWKDKKLVYRDEER